MLRSMLSIETKEWNLSRRTSLPVWLTSEGVLSPTDSCFNDIIQTLCAMALR